MEWVGRSCSSVIGMIWVNSSKQESIVEDQSIENIYGRDPCNASSKEKFGDGIL